MESMGMANWFGEMMGSLAEMVISEVYTEDDLNPDIDFAEMDKLERLLVEANIPYEKVRMFHGKQLKYPCGGDDMICSVILHNGSYGRERGLLEIMGLLTDEELECDTVAGSLTADDVFGRIKKHWEEKGEE